MAQDKKIGTKLISSNKKAHFNYLLFDKFEAGISLLGTEIKSIRKNGANLTDSYIKVTDNLEAYLIGCHISPYEFGNIYNKDPLRTRKLLLTKREINKLFNLIKQKSVSLIPIKLYFKNNIVKLELGIGKGKKLYDKRQDIAKKDAEMKIKKALKNNF